MRLGTEAAERRSGAHNLVVVRQIRSAGDVIAYKRKTENEVHGRSLFDNREGRADDEEVYYCIDERLKLEGETENMGICTKERKGITAEVLVDHSWPLPCRERRLFVLKRPRCDINGGSETEVTVTSKRHAQAEKAKK